MGMENALQQHSTLFSRRGGLHGACLDTMPHRAVQMGISGCRWQPMGRHSGCGQGVHRAAGQYMGISCMGVCGPPPSLHSART